MKKLVKNIRVVLVAVLFLSAPFCVQAQGGFDDDVEDNPVPFDGGATLLVAAAVGYGLKKARDIKRAKKLGEQEKEK